MVHSPILRLRPPQSPLDAQKTMRYDARYVNRKHAREFLFKELEKKVAPASIRNSQLGNPPREKLIPFTLETGAPNSSKSTLLG